MKGDNAFIETIEDIVKEPKLVGQGIVELERFSGNAPSFDPERRRFLKHAAVLAGGIVLFGKAFISTSGCAAPTVQHNGKTYSGREAYLMTQDLIRGPSLLIHPETRRPSDFEHHKQRPINQGWGSVDYDVPIGTPIVPTADAYSKKPFESRSGGLVLELDHLFNFRSSYGHLDRYTEVIDKGSGTLNKLIIVAFSGNTGRGPGQDGYQPPHLDFSIRTRGPPGYDPFKLGIDQKKLIGDKDQFGLPLGGRPVYWDGRTKIAYGAFSSEWLQESLDTLPSRLKESKLDKATIDEILKRRNNPIELRDYLGMRVLQKKPSAPDGKPRYEFMPGSLMYALMLEFYNRTSRHDFIAMLPFIFPHPKVKVHYQRANPGVRF